MGILDCSAVMLVLTPKGLNEEVWLEPVAGYNLLVWRVRAASLGQLLRGSPLLVQCSGMLE